MNQLIINPKDMQYVLFKKELEEKKQKTVNSATIKHGNCVKPNLLEFKDNTK